MWNNYITVQNISAKTESSQSSNSSHWSSSRLGCVMPWRQQETTPLLLLTFVTTCHDVISTSLKWRPTFDRELTRYSIGPEPFDDWVRHVSSTPLLCGLSSSIGMSAAFGIPAHQTCTYVTYDTQYSITLHNNGNKVLDLAPV